MDFLEKVRKAAQAAGRVGQRLPTTSEMVFGKKQKPRPKPRKATKRRRH